ncbi:hypothetical protein RJ640_023871 [Escallonia rubra]|uniref:Phospholipase D C-terminal domain-containing protein n=1 Tax=Escallonia rubra TaxID=112253 RepID=A0AA88RFC2_9ASTE|nr:hypothetical protein RJ640_023871 [Escallonia rubra]
MISETYKITPIHCLLVGLGAFGHQEYACDYLHLIVQIYGYRKSLWAEHIGDLEECFERPESLECVRRVRSLGELNWKQYAAEEVTQMKGHLLKYPVEVDRKGNVDSLPGCETFPDVGGSIVEGLGKYLSVLQERGPRSSHAIVGGWAGPLRSAGEVSIVTIVGGWAGPLRSASEVSIVTTRELISTSWIEMVIGTPREGAAIVRWVPR